MEKLVCTLRTIFGLAMSYLYFRNLIVHVYKNKSSLDTGQVVLYNKYELGHIDCAKHVLMFPYICINILNSKEVLMEKIFINVQMPMIPVHSETTKYGLLYV